QLLDAQPAACGGMRAARTTSLAKEEHESISKLPLAALRKQDNGGDLLAVCRDKWTGRLGRQWRIASKRRLGLRTGRLPRFNPAQPGRSQRAARKRRCARARPSFRQPGDRSDPGRIAVGPWLCVPTFRWVCLFEEREGGSGSIAALGKMALAEGEESSGPTCTQTLPQESGALKAGR